MVDADPALQKSAWNFSPLSPSKTHLNLLHRLHAMEPLFALPTPGPDPAEVTPEVLPEILEDALWLAVPWTVADAAGWLGVELDDSREADWEPMAAVAVVPALGAGSDDEEAIEEASSSSFTLVFAPPPNPDPDASSVFKRP